MTKNTTAPKRAGTGIDRAGLAAEIVLEFGDDPAALSLLVQLVHQMAERSRTLRRRR